ncbi:protein phosphatase 1 regulatory subunit 32 isoform X2 [Accipiter gentilis]|uniref:protein phosphatase 1 regulatory subunit 32 isoform X2 n=1 Tax=Astur gentilis TaxID=8957 RepID=UPI00210FCD68|nr:protein phosphatase 1 regulatory subunit 32 isoform X2 [Accipiter gentilis]
MSLHRSYQETASPSQGLSCRGAGHRLPLGEGTHRGKRRPHELLCHELRGGLRPAAFPSLPRPPHQHRLCVQQPLGHLLPALPAQCSRGVGTPAASGGGGGGGNFWDHAVTATLASHHSHCQDTATSTTTEHFKPFLLPDGRSLLPRHVHQPESGYLQESSLFLPPHRGGDSPAHAASPGPPRASREHGTESRRAGPAQPDVLQKTTIGAKEQSGFTRATPRSDSILPVLPAQPLGVSITATDYLPSVRSHCGETLPALPVGSERGNGFSREVPGCLGTVVSGTPSHCPSPCALPVLIHYPHTGLACGGPPHPTCLPRAAGTLSDPGQPAGTAGCWQEGGCRHGLVPVPAGPCTQPTSIPPGSIGVHH